VKPAGAALARLLARPDPDCPAWLIWGADPMRVRQVQRDLATALAGPQAAAEMRIGRLAGPDVRRDPAALADALKAQGFFAGPRVVLLDEATDALAQPLAAALAAARPGDAVLIAAAGALPAKSPLRRLFESDTRAVAVALHDDPPGREEIAAELARAGCGPVGPEAMAALEALARAIGRGELRQLAEKLALYRLGAEGAATAGDVAAVAPAATEAGVDEMAEAVAEGRTEALGPMFARLAAQGVGPVALCLGVARHFRLLHAAAADPEGPAAALARARPPVFGPRRDRLARQARGWGVARLESALTLLFDTDLALRSGGRAPQMALVGTALVSLARAARRDR
jgi:DNA polymerase-3 subunit delta